MRITVQESSLSELRDAINQRLREGYYLIGGIHEPKPPSVNFWQVMEKD